LISPLYGDLHGLPPLYISVGDDENMLDDSTRFAEKAKNSGVEVTLKTGEGMVHCYPALSPLFPEAKKAMEDKRVMNMMRKLFIFPKFIRSLILRILIQNPFSVKKMSGTTMITSVSMFGKIPGFAIPYMIGQRAVSFALGSVTGKPAITGEDILIREFLSLTVVFNHDIVDGAPAARFTNRLKKRIERAEVL